MTDHKNNSELDNYLSGGSDLSKLYQASKKNEDTGNLNEPDLNLDSAILAAAKREVNSKPVKPKKNYSPFSNNYFIPVSTAASIFIVVVMVSFFPEKQQIEFEPYPESSAAPTTPVAPIAKSAELEENVMPTLLDSSLVEKKVVGTKPQKLFRKKSNDILLREEVRSVKNKQKVKVAQRTRAPQVKKEASNINLTKETSIAQNRKRAKAVAGSESKISTMKSESDPRTVLGSDIMEADTNESSADNYTNDDVVSDVYNSEQEQSMGAVTLETNSVQPMSNFVAGSSSERADYLVYDEQRWRALSSDEWLTRIKKIFQLHGEKETKIVIEHFNKKFLKLKININDYRSNIKK